MGGANIRSLFVWRGECVGKLAWSSFIASSVHDALVIVYCNGERFRLFHADIVWFLNEACVKITDHAWAAL